MQVLKVFWSQKITRSKMKMIVIQKNIIVMKKKNFDKELVMTKNDDENFENCNKFWICHNDFVHGDVKVRDHCHINEQHRDHAHRMKILLQG